MAWPLRVQVWPCTWSGRPARAACCGSPASKSILAEIPAPTCLILEMMGPTQHFSTSRPPGRRTTGGTESTCMRDYLTPNVSLVQAAAASQQQRRKTHPCQPSAARPCCRSWHLAVSLRCRSFDLAESNRCQSSALAESFRCRSSDLAENLRCHISNLAESPHDIR